MPGEALRFARVTDPAAPEMEALLAIYEKAIPLHERKGEDAVRAMATSPDHRVEVAIDAGGVAGFSLVWVGTRVALLEYLAVDQGRRGSGLGAALFCRVAGASSPLLLEVEPDGEPGPDQAMRARRIGFYRRLGCRRVEGMAFQLPLPGAETTLDLMVSGYPTATVGRPLLRRWLIDVYVGVYGCAADDPRIAAMLAGTQDPASLV